MITHKSNISPLPYKRKVGFRKRHWYLFPQRWTWRKSVAEIRYERENIYSHQHFWLIYQYQFSWLFIDIVWEVLPDYKGMCKSEVRHEPIQYVTEQGDIYNS